MTPTTTTIRELSPSDRSDLRSLLEGLSPEDRHRRFLRAMPRIPESVIDALSAIDGHDHVAVGAFEGDRLVGVARFVRLPDEPATAEVAVTVAATHRRAGLGRRLIESLVSMAPERDIDTLEVQIDPANLPARSLAGSLGFRFAFDGHEIVGRRDVTPVSARSLDPSAPSRSPFWS